MGPVMFQILSDLHLETHPTYEYKFKQTAPYLALLGDIGHVGNERLFSFLEKQLNRFWVVFFLLGNHEPTRSSWTLTKQRVREFEMKMDNLHKNSTTGKFVFLDQTRYDLNNTITILGCTLFSNVKTEQLASVSSKLVDFKYILDWNVEDHIKAHISDLAWLNSQIQAIFAEDPKRQIVILTHYCPSADRQANNPAHAESDVMSAFVTDLSIEACWRSSSVVMWAFGHTHFNCEFTDELGKKVVSNQKGYYSKPEEDFSAKETVCNRQGWKYVASILSFTDVSFLSLSSNPGAFNALV